MRLEGQVVRVQPMGTGYVDGIIYIRLDHPVKNYDPCDTSGFFYAVTRGRWAGINDNIRYGNEGDKKVRLGDSILVEGRGLNDSIFVYRCDSLLAKKPILISTGSIYNSALHRSFKWPPPDSLIGRGLAAQKSRNCP